MKPLCWPRGIDSELEIGQRIKWCFVFFSKLSLLFSFPRVEFDYMFFALIYEIQDCFHQFVSANITKHAKCRSTGTPNDIRLEREEDGERRGGEKEMDEKTGKRGQGMRNSELKQNW